MRRIGFILSYLFIFLGFGELRAQPAEEVERVARQLLEAISTRDTTMFRAAMTPDGVLMGVVSREGQVFHRARSVDDYIAMLNADGPVLLERMWDPEIRIDGLLASVWTRYDFYADGEFSHCGTDAFHVVRTVEGWKIRTVIYTIEPDKSECPESPHD